MAAGGRVTRRLRPLQSGAPWPPGTRRYPMNELLTPSWWVLALRGAVALLFGVVALMLPGLTLLWLVALYAVYAVFGGAVSLVGAVKTRNSDKGWWLMLLFGLVSIGAGVVAFLYPGLTALVLVLLMGANALIT